MEFINKNANLYLDNLDTLGCQLEDFEDNDADDTDDCDDSEDSEDEEQPQY